MIKKEPFKQPKVVAPVLKSHFGDAKKNTFQPLASATKMEPKGMEPKVDPIDNDSFAVQDLPPPKQVSAKTIVPKPDSIESELPRRLPKSSTKVQPKASSSFEPQFSTLRKKDKSQNDFVRQDSSAFVAQTSNFEPVKSTRDKSELDKPRASFPATVSAFSPSKPVKKSFGKTKDTYTTKQGDSLWTIAQATYGDGRYFRALHELNHDTLALSDSIPTGTVLSVPPAVELRNDYPELCPAPEQKLNKHDAAVNEALDDEMDKRYYSVVITLLVSVFR